MPSIAIDPRVGGGPVVELKPCAGTTVVMTMPAGTRIFEDGATRGLAGGDASLTIHRDGTLEYDSPTAEYSLTLPAGLGADLFAAFAGRNGQELEDEIELDDADAENPQQDEENPQNAGRKRRSGVKKQTRRSQRKRRNTVRR
jgi:hypothetical protein